MAAGQQHPLAGTDWSDLFRRLAAYAVVLYRIDRVMPGTGMSPEDLAGSVIVQLLQGNVRYDGRRPLVPLLKKVLYHDFLDLKKSAARRTTVIFEPTENEAGQLVGGLDSLPAVDEAPADLLVRETVYEVIADDQELRDFACAILELGASKPSDIASLLGVSVDEVENRRKRLRRMLAPVRARLGA
jgi:DNA-directed RNA polymerase specialized sigma24 family protein